MPRTSTNFSIISSSVSWIISSAFNRPSTKRWLRSWTYSTFRPLSPAVRNTSCDFVNTCWGVGKNPVGGFPSWSGSLNSRINLRWMAFAAEPLICWLRIPLTSDLYGSPTSASPFGEYTWHSFFSRSALNRGSTEIRCLDARSRNVACKSDWGSWIHWWLTGDCSVAKVGSSQVPGFGGVALLFFFSWY